MFRVGILGCENSHAEAFINIFQGSDSYSDIKVVGVGSNYPESAKYLYETYKLDFIADKPEDMLGKVDAIMVTARDGKYHYRFAEPYVKAGLPAFIDKPFTSDGQEALALARLAKEHNAPLCGGSSIKLADNVLMLKDARENKLGKICGGSVAAPMSMENIYGGFYFYTSHLVEVSLKIFGYDPKAVTAIEKDNHITATVEYDNYLVSNHFMNECYLSYFGSVYGQEGNASTNIDYSKAYEYECMDFAQMLRTGKSTLSLRELIAPVFYLNAVEKSYKSGGTRQLIEIPEI